MARGIDFEDGSGGTAYTTEEAIDAAGGAMRSSTTVAVVFSDASDTITPHVIPGSLGTDALSFDPATQTELDTVAARQTINTQTGSIYTLVLTDAGKIIEMTTTTVNTVVIPTNASVAFSTGTRIDIARIGGQVTIGTNSTVVTIRSARSYLKLASQYSVATVYKRDTDEWVLGGDLTT